MQNELEVQGFAGPPKGPPAHVSHVTHCPHTELAWPQEGINEAMQSGHHHGEVPSASTLTSFSYFFLFFFFPL